MFSLKHNNKKTTCPPGKLPIGHDSPIIIIPTYRRTGTHLLIDTIFNNFRGYRNSPLYIDLDQWVKQGRSVDELLDLRGVIIKTHLPNPKINLEPEALKKLLSGNTKIISTERDSDEILQSLQKSFGFDIDMAEMRSEMALFNDFWNGLEKLTFHFNELTDRTQTGNIVSKISAYIGVEANKTLLIVPKKSERKKVYLRKLLTRLLGKYSPVVNTTVGFAKTKR